MASPLSRLLRRLLLTSLALLVVSLTATSPASAHAELRQSSPGAGETVGGEFHQIALQFTGINPNVPHEVELFGPDGQLVTSGAAQEDQRLVLGIEPLEIPGQYTVSYDVTGIDGDFTSESFSFRYEPSADEPKGITVALAEPQGFDFVGFGLLLIGAALLAFLVHRFLSALREHRAARASSTAGG